MNEVSARTPSVAVLMATFNGAPWLAEQLRSIYAQQDVDVFVVASDDGSTDSTRGLLEEWARTHALVVLPTLLGILRSANRNFLRVILDAPLNDATHVALADQDDLWEPAKCARAVAELTRLDADAYSSDVIAFWPDGRRRYIRKSQPLRAFDHLFESAGPGCTFVFRRAAFDRLRTWVGDNLAALQEARVHDWSIYAHARTMGWRWVIDPHALILYRQHSANETGANAGWRAAAVRLRAVFSGTYRRNTILLAAAVGDCSWVSTALRRFDVVDRLRLAMGARHLRRRFRDAFGLGLLFLLMRKNP